MNLTFFGAAQTTTGSMHLVETNGKRILLDCGLYQGNRKEAFERNRTMPVDPAALDAVVLSHAHIDHSGNLPTLARHGFRGKIYCTPATATSAHLLRDIGLCNRAPGRSSTDTTRRPGKNLFEPPVTNSRTCDAIMSRFAPEPHKRLIDWATVTVVTLTTRHILLGDRPVTKPRSGGNRRLLILGDSAPNQDPPRLRLPHRCRRAADETQLGRSRPLGRRRQGRLKDSSRIFTS
jgi:metallo-beta-lactamase family protein